MILLYLLKHGEKLTIMREKLVLLFESGRGNKIKVAISRFFRENDFTKKKYIYLRRIGNITRK